MLASELITSIRYELKESSAAFWSDAELLSYINRAERDFNNRTRLLEGMSTLSMEAGRLEYPLPPGYLSIKSVWVKEVNTSDSSLYEFKRLFPTNLERMAQNGVDIFQTASSYRGTPQRYWIWDRKIFVDPAPSVEGQELYVFYKKAPTTLTSTSDTLNTDESLIDAIEAYVLWRAWKKENEEEYALAAKADYLDGVRAGLRWAKKQSGDQLNQMDARTSIPLWNNQQFIS